VVGYLVNDGAVALRSFGEVGVTLCVFCCVNVDDDTSFKFTSDNLKDRSSGSC